MFVTFQSDQLLSSDGSHSRLSFPLVIFFLIPLLFGCGPGLQKATVKDIEQAKQNWQLHPVLDYSIVVDVQGQIELRRNSLVIQDGKIHSADVQYWNPDFKKWESGRTLNQQQAFPFTVPGLLMTVEEEILNSGRNDVWISLTGDPPVPQTIVLGPLIQNNNLIEGSKTFLFVRTFQVSKSDA
jgi:hypothetical protein